MGALGRGPTPQQNVDADAQVNQRDQPQSAIQGPVGWSQNQRRFQVHALARKRVGGFGPHSCAIELPLQAADVGYVPPVHRDQVVAQLDAGLLAGTVDVHPGCPQVATVFHPPNAIGRGGKLIFLLEVDPRKDDRRHAQQREDNGKKARL